MNDRLLVNNAQIQTNYTYPLYHCTTASPFGLQLYAFRYNENSVESVCSHNITQQSNLYNRQRGVIHNLTEFATKNFKMAAIFQYGGRMLLYYHTSVKFSIIVSHRILQHNGRSPMP